MSRIGDWTAQELRSFVVNQILTDPGAYPKQEPTPVGTGFPTTVTNQDVPVWDKASQTWKTRTLPSARIQSLDDVSYIRIQGGLVGFIADLNFRIYNISSATTVLEQDTAGRLRNAGGGSLSIDVAGNYLIGGYVAGAAGSYEAGWTLCYNGVSIDVTAQNAMNTGSLGAVQPMGVSYMTMTNWFSSPGLVQLGGFQNTGTINVAGLWAMWLPT